MTKIKNIKNAVAENLTNEVGDGGHPLDFPLKEWMGLSFNEQGDIWSRAAESGDLDTVKAVLHVIKTFGGADISTLIRTDILRKAALAGQNKVVRFLLPDTYQNITEAFFYELADEGTPVTLALFASHMTQEVIISTFIQVSQFGDVRSGCFEYLYSLLDKSEIKKALSELMALREKAVADSIPYHPATRGESSILARMKIDENKKELAGAARAVSNKKTGLGATRKI